MQLVYNLQKILTNLKMILLCIANPFRHLWKYFYDGVARGKQLEKALFLLITKKNVSQKIWSKIPSSPNRAVTQANLLVSVVGEERLYILLGNSHHCTSNNGVKYHKKFPCLLEKSWNLARLTYNSNHHSLINWKIVSRNWLSILSL